MVARNKIVISGTIAGGLENWSCSQDYVLDGGGSVTGQSDLQAWADLAAAALSAGEASYPQITGMMGAFVDATEVAVYGYEANGPAVAVGVSACGWSGSGTVDVPFSTCVCVSKRTSRAGRSGRGRMYWPALGASIGSNGEFVLPAEIADQFAELVVDLGNVDGVSTAIAVVTSQVLNLVTPVTEIRVGDVPDSQRRRRDRLVETYQSAVIIP